MLFRDYLLSYIYRRLRKHLISNYVNGERIDGNDNTSYDLFIQLQAVQKEILVHILYK